MVAITFIYKIKKNPTVYYGKCVYYYISDDHYGLDNKVRQPLIKAINHHRKLNGYSIISSKDIMIGIIALYYDYSTKREKKCFDFYYVENDYFCHSKINTNEIFSISYINGRKMIEEPYNNNIY